jgi:hypothetical protein
MNIITKGLVGTVAAGAMALASASPAMARDGRHHDHDGISAGDVIAGALVIGGIAAIASAASHHDRDRYDYNYPDGRYGPRGYDGWNDYRSNPRQAVAMCVNTATREANRQSYGGRARVTDIRDIDPHRDGYTVRGRIAVNTWGRDWRRGDRDYGRGWDDDYRGWNRNLRGYDSGSFTCEVRYGRVVDLDFHGIRGLR